MRHICELTPKEGGALWDEIMPYPAHKPFIGSAYKYQESDTTPERFIFMSGLERLCVQFDGKIWADSDLMPIDIDKQKAVEFLKNIGILLNLNLG